MMTAEAAAQTWFTRASQIEQTYRSNPAAAHDEANVAVRGISALLQNRSAELSDSTIDRLGTAADRLAAIAAGTLEEAQESPWWAGLTEAKDSVKEDLMATKYAAGAGARGLAEFGRDMKWTLIAVAALVLFIGMRRI